MASEEAAKKPWQLLTPGAAYTGDSPRDQVLCDLSRLFGALLRPGGSGGGGPSAAGTSGRGGAAAGDVGTAVVACAGGGGGGGMTLAGLAAEVQALRDTKHYVKDYHGDQRNPLAAEGGSTMPLRGHPYSLQWAWVIRKSRCQGMQDEVGLPKAPACTSTAHLSPAMLHRSSQAILCIVEGCNGFGSLQMRRPAAPGCYWSCGWRGWRVPRPRRQLPRSAGAAAPRGRPRRRWSSSRRPPG